MNINHSPSSRWMKNNTFSVQYSDEISWAHEGKICMWAGIIVPCTLHMSTTNSYPNPFNIHLSKCLSFISTIACQELGYI